MPALLALPAAAVILLVVLASDEQRSPQEPVLQPGGPELPIATGAAPAPAGGRAPMPEAKRTRKRRISGRRFQLILPSGWRAERTGNGTAVHTSPAGVAEVRVRVLRAASTSELLGRVERWVRRRAGGSRVARTDLRRRGELFALARARNGSEELTAYAGQLEPGRYLLALESRPRSGSRIASDQARALIRSLAPR